jgi:hypothetical protein
VPALGGIYRAKGVGASLLPPYRCAWGAALSCPTTTTDEVANRCGWQGAAPPVFHYDGTWGIGFWQSTWQEGVKKKKTKVVFFPCCTSRGRRRRNCVAQNDTVLFFFFNMKRRRFGQNTPFHLNIAPTHQLPNQSLIYPLFI